MARTFRRFDNQRAADTRGWDRAVAKDNRFIRNKDGSLITRDGISETSFRSLVKKESARKARRTDIDLGEW